LENAVAFSHISTARRLLHSLYSDSAQNPSLGIILGLEKTEIFTTPEQKVLLNRLCSLELE
jgi:hypothetical protein